MAVCAPQPLLAQPHALSLSSFELPLTVDPDQRPSELVCLGDFVVSSSLRSPPADISEDLRKQKRLDDIIKLVLDADKPSVTLLYALLSHLQSKSPAAVAVHPKLPKLLDWLIHRLEDSEGDLLAYMQLSTALILLSLRKQMTQREFLVPRLQTQLLEHIPRQSKFDVPNELKLASGYAWLTLEAMLGGVEVPSATISRRTSIFLDPTTSEYRYASTTVWLDLLWEWSTSLERDREHVSTVITLLLHFASSSRSSQPHSVLPRILRALAACFFNGSDYLSAVSRVAGAKLCVSVLERHIDGCWAESAMECLYALRCIDAVTFVSSTEVSLAEEKTRKTIGKIFNDELISLLFRCATPYDLHYRHRSINSAAIKTMLAVSAHHAGRNVLLANGAGLFISVLSLVDTILPTIFPFTQSKSMHTILYRLKLPSPSIVALLGLLRADSDVGILGELKRHCVHYRSSDIRDADWKPHETFLEEHFHQSFATSFVRVLRFLQPMSPYPTALQPLLKFAIQMTVSKPSSDEQAPLSSHGLIEPHELFELKDSIWVSSDIEDDVDALDEMPSTNIFFILTRIGIQTEMARDWSQQAENQPALYNLVSDVPESLLSCIIRCEKEYAANDTVESDVNDAEEDEEVTFSKILSRDLKDVLAEDWIERLESERRAFGLSPRAILSLWKERALPLLRTRRSPSPLKEAASAKTFSGILDIDNKAIRYFNLPSVLFKKKNDDEDEGEEDQDLKQVEINIRNDLGLAQDDYITYHVCRSFTAADNKLRDPTQLLTTESQDFGRSPARYLYPRFVEASWACGKDYKPSDETATAVIGYVWKHDTATSLHITQFECVIPESLCAWHSAILYSRGIQLVRSIGNWWTADTCAFGALAHHTEPCRYQQTLKTPLPFRLMTLSGAPKQKKAIRIKRDEFVPPPTASTDLAAIMESLRSATPPQVLEGKVDHVTQIAIRGEALKKLAACESFVVFMDSRCFGKADWELKQKSEPE